MRKPWLAGVALAALVTNPAAAADMPVKAPPVAVAPAFSWTGFYLGGGFGYGAYTFKNQDFLTVPAFLEESREYSTGGKGWLGTVIVGTDYQFASNWVAGIFADYDWTQIRGGHLFHDAFAAGTVKQRSAWAVGGRLGYLVAPTTLFYATGGYTEARFSGATFVDASGFACCFQNAATFTGWFIGTGAEIHLWSNWFGRLEYRYAHYRDKIVPVFESSGVPYSPSAVVTRIEPTVQTIRAAITYKLNLAGAAAPAYAAARPVPASSWTGFYVGAGVGHGAYTTRNLDLVNGGPSNTQGYSSGGKGWLGTVVVGADYQFAGTWVAGVFADYDWTNIEGGHVAGGLGIGPLKLTSSWAVGGRLGYLIAPTTLLYATGGHTQARFSGVTLFDPFGPTPFPIRGSVNPVTFSGWFVGAGAEAQLWSSLFGRLEYRYAAHESKTLPIFNPDGTLSNFSTRVEPTIQTIRAELTYRFNWASPLVARY